MARAALLLSCLLFAGMVAGFLDYLHHSGRHDPPVLDLEQAAAYSREYALAFDPTLGGPSHLSRALGLNGALRASLNLSLPPAREAGQVLDLQRLVLQDASLFPGEPQDALAGLVGSGGGARVAQALKQAIQDAENGLRTTAGPATNATGYAKNGIGFAPGIPDLQDYWRTRLDRWQAVAAQLAEARAGYGSFFGNAANGTLEGAERLMAQANPAAEQLYSVPARAQSNASFAPADAVGLAVATAQRLRPDTAVVVGLDARGDVGYCAFVQGHRLCPVPLVEDVLNVTGPARLGVVSAMALDAQAPDGGGIVGIFNPGSHSTGHLDVQARSLDGTWNSTANLGPVPADGARIAVFEHLGDGPAMLSVRQDGQVLLQWVGQSATGLGLLMD